MKSIWITALAENQARASAVTAHLKTYGLKCQGHFWQDAPEKQAWRPALESLLEAKADVWLILADDAEFAKPSVRYGLSMMAAALRQTKSAGCQILLLWNSPAPAVNNLPQPLQSATVIEEAASSWAAKVVAKASMPGKPTAQAYRLGILGDERLGQWFELGPVDQSWDGFVFGIQGEGCEINFQAVGPGGSLPEKASLEYAQQGLKIQAGAREFTAWAVRNQIADGDSYFARVKGCPNAILFMPYPQDTCEPADDTESADVAATIVVLQ